MKTTRFYNRFLCFAALAALLSGNAFADVVYDSNSYFALANPSSWELSGTYRPETSVNGKFNLQNVDTNEMSMIKMYSSGCGWIHYVVDNKIVPRAHSFADGASDSGWGVSLSTEAAIDSFYLKFNGSTRHYTWSSSTIGAGGKNEFASHLSMIATDSFGNKHVTHQLISEDMFFGFILDAGYFTDIKWYWSDGTDDVVFGVNPYDGYYTKFVGRMETFEFGFGNGTLGSANPVPEPATMLITGLGIAVVAATRRIRYKGRT